MKKIILFLCIFLLNTHTVFAKDIAIKFENAQPKNLNFFDNYRNRLIPVALYVNSKLKDKTKTEMAQLPLVIINHGYGAKNTEYSFIANALAAQGYFVVSIQHDLDADAPLPRTGNLYQQRKPLWDRGVQNILWVISEMKNSHPDLNLNKIILIGHSNGGDISMMFTNKYPEKVSKVISLDSLRYPFPSNMGIPILHFSANDTKADSGVIPIHGVKTVAIDNAKHLDLCDRGGPYINDTIVQTIVQFLK